VRSIATAIIVAGWAAAATCLIVAGHPWFGGVCLLVALLETVAPRG
jgi:hypothetical protein